MKSEVVALIPAREGSKGVPGKNIRPLAGYPLLAWAIMACRLCPEIQRTLVSTDSPRIADLAREFGAEVPFLRPPEYARDNSPDRDFVIHAMDWFTCNEGGDPRYLVHVRPTTPLRRPDVLAAAVETIRRDPTATGLRSVHELAESPYKMFGLKEGYLVGLYPDDPRPEYYNLPRQSFPPVFHPNGYVDIIKTETVRHGPSLHGSCILGFVTSPAIEVDRPEDFDLLETIVEKKEQMILTHLRQNSKGIVA